MNFFRFIYDFPFECKACWFCSSWKTYPVEMICSVGPKKYSAIFVRCLKCQASGPVFDNYNGEFEFEITKKAIIAWNERKI